MAGSQDSLNPLSLLDNQEDDQTHYDLTIKFPN